MKTGFNDPIEVKSGKRKKSPWDFTCPDYDERSSCYINAGSHYGVGHRQPVGHEGSAKATSPVLPKGRVATMSTDDIPRKNLSIEMEQ